jgi:large repetitive protein
MRKIFGVLLVTGLTLFSCEKNDFPARPSAAPTPAATTSSAPPAPKGPSPVPSVSLAADAPIPGNGLALWLTGDDAMKSVVGGKITSWTNPLVSNVSASATDATAQPSVVASAANGHAAVRFDGEANMLKTNIDISPASWPDVTVITVFNSATEETSPLRSVYGDDNSDYDRAAGLDNRSGDGKNYVIFAGDRGVAGYFALKANQLYLSTDQYTATEFNGWVDGKPAITKFETHWGEALPNMYIGGTGTSYNQFWKGDIAEIIVYARVLTDAERVKIEDYLAKKYRMTLTR